MTSWEEAQPKAIYAVNTNRNLTGSVDYVNSYQQEGGPIVYPEEL